MSLGNRSDVHADPAATRRHYSTLMMPRARESDTTGDFSAYDHVLADKDEQTEALAILVERSKTLLTFAQTNRNGA